LIFVGQQVGDTREHVSARAASGELPKASMAVDAAAKAFAAWSQSTFAAHKAIL
jgi:acyl-CoA reductase-like NAD-dependent aldehyde dehydrogenase